MILIMSLQPKIIAKKMLYMDIWLKADSVYSLLLVYFESVMLSALIRILSIMINFLNSEEHFMCHDAN